jgi:hypothetical protein
LTARDPEQAGSLPADELSLIQKCSGRLQLQDLITDRNAAQHSVPGCCPTKCDAPREKTDGRLGLRLQAPPVGT